MSRLSQCPHCSASLTQEDQQTRCSACGNALPSPSSADAPAWWVESPASPTPPVESTAVSVELPDYLASADEPKVGPPSEPIPVQPIHNAEPVAEPARRLSPLWIVGVMGLLCGLSALGLYLARPNEQTQPPEEQHASGTPTDTTPEQPPVEPTEPSTTPDPVEDPVEPEPKQPEDSDPPEPKEPKVTKRPTKYVPPGPPPPPPAVVTVPETETKPETKPNEPKPMPEPMPEPMVVVQKPEEFVHVRRSKASEQELAKLIAMAPEVALDRSPRRLESVEVLARSRSAFQAKKQIDFAPLLAKKRPDLAGLPLEMGDKCRLTPTMADHLQGASVSLRTHLVSSTGGSRGDPRPDPQKLSTILNADGQRHSKWHKSEAIPALLQLLMAENESIRVVLVEQLSLIKGKEATEALAKRALYDLNPEVRYSALKALRDRPTSDYAKIFLSGFRHPWPVIANHAAEAIASLEMKETVPELLTLLDEPHASLPFKKPGSTKHVIREMVRINHFRNCLLCHPASFETTDKVRGAVPSTDAAIPTTVAYYKKPGDFFVRADITYLRQDFSAPLPVADPGLWPAVQRFDFLVRERFASPQEVALASKPELTRAPSEQQKAMFFALRKVTGKDPGPSVADWKRLFFKGTGKIEKLPIPQTTAGGIAVDAEGQLFAVDAKNQTLSRWTGDSLAASGEKLSGTCSDIAFTKTGRLIACQPKEKRIVARDVNSDKIEVLAEQFEDKPLLGPAYLAIDKQGGVYFTDEDAESGKARLCFLSSQGNITLLNCGLAHPRGLALSPNEKTLYIADVGRREVWAYPLESAGSLQGGEALCRIDATESTDSYACDLVVDQRGNVYVANPNTRQVQIVNKAGARLGQVVVPESPRFLALAPDEDRMYVSSPKSIFRVDLLGKSSGAP